MFVLLLSIATMAMAIIKAVSIVVGIRQFSVAQRLLWQGLEGSIIIIGGSLLPLMPLGRTIRDYFRRMLDSVISKTGSSSGQQNTKTSDNSGSGGEIPRTIGSLTVRPQRQVDEFGLTRLSEELPPESRAGHSTTDGHSSDGRFAEDWEGYEKPDESRTIELKALP